ncbi:MAG: M28 family peptidase [Fretibacterium sp.]|nr:M28 family peptidase [Fretibacterium sp.]
MLTQSERDCLSRLDTDSLLEDLRVVASFERRPDSEGEENALSFIRGRLDGAEIQNERSSQLGLLSLGGSGTLRLAGLKEEREFPVKAWNFSPSAPGSLTGRSVVMGRDDFPSSPLEFFASEKPKERDLEGHVVLAPFASTEAVLSAQARGATAFVICWPQPGENVIHQSGLALWWGAVPQPEESCWSPRIPVVALSGRDGATLMELAGASEVFSLSLSCRSEERVAPVPLLEALVPATVETPFYVLVGAHLDSKYYGATDNATGAALLLSLAEALARLPERRAGIRFCWWMGHEFGKYGGSSLYARDRLADLNENCLAYVNIDMPGLRGATDFAVTAGPDLAALASGVFADVLGNSPFQVHPGRVRSWDQSFQNVGVSSLFIWSSSLPPDSPDTTGGGVMPWWWHTESDLVEFCDPEVLGRDAKLYLLGLLRLLAGPEEAFDLPALWEALLGRLGSFSEDFSKSMELNGPRASLQDSLSFWRSRKNCCLKENLPVLRLLNRMYYSARAPWLQDWSGSEGPLPALSEAERLLNEERLSERGHLIVRNYARCQAGRLALMAQELARLSGRVG